VNRKSGFGNRWLTSKYGVEKEMHTDPDETIQSNDNQIGSKSPVKKYSPNPIAFIWLAVFFFVVDYFAFQKPLPRLVSWLLIVVPLSLLAIAFFLFARRKQFPWFWFGIPFNSFVAYNLMQDVFENKKNYVFHSIMILIMLICLIAIATISFFDG